MEFLNECEADCCEQWNIFTKDADSSSFTDVPLLEKYCVARVDRLSNDEKNMLLDCITGNGFLQNCVSLTKSEKIEDDKSTYEQLQVYFYNVVRFGSVALLKLLIERTAIDDYATNSYTERILERILGETYDELKWKHVNLTEEMETFVVNTLTSMRFFSGKADATCNENNFQDAKHRMECISSCIEYLITEYKSKEVDAVFLAAGIYIAQGLTTLKRIMKVSYTVLPWEEIEFCLVKFISTYREKVDYIYKLILTKEDILLYLETFHQKLKNTDVDLTTRAKKTNRKENMKRILNETEIFKGLYSKFELMKDIHSLKYIESYLTPAVRIDLDKNEFSELGKFVIQRTLQVLGENLKSTTESPNLSDGVSKVISDLAPRKLKEIVTALRNPLSHAYSLTNKLKIEENQQFFVELQNDLKKINNVLGRILYKLKLQAIKTFLQKILDSENLNDIKRQISNIDIHNEFQTEYKMCLTSELSGIRNMIDQTYDLTKNESLREYIEKVKTQFNDVGIDNDISTYSYLTTSLYDLLTEIRRSEKLEPIKRKTRISLQKLVHLSELEHKGMSEIKPLVVEILAELKRDKSMKNMMNLPLKIFHHIEVELIHLKSIESCATFGDRLEEPIKRDDEMFQLLEDIKEDIPSADDLKIFSEMIEKLKRNYEVKLELLRLFDKKQNQYREIYDDTNKLSYANSENARNNTEQKIGDLSKGKGLNKSKENQKLKQSNKTKKSAETSNKITLTSKKHLEEDTTKGTNGDLCSGENKDKDKEENCDVNNCSSERNNMSKHESSVETINDDKRKNTKKQNKKCSVLSKDKRKDKNNVGIVDEAASSINDAKEDNSNECDTKTHDHTNKMAIDYAKSNSNDKKKVLELLEKLHLQNKDKIICSYDEHKFKNCKDLLSLAVADKLSNFLKKLEKSSLGSKSDDLKVFLKSVNVKTELVSKIVEISRKKLQNEFEKRLKELLVLLKDKTVENRFVQIATEMILIDLFEMLESANLFGNNRGNVDGCSPLLIGKELRNYLAHGDPLIDLLPFSTWAAILSNIWELEAAKALFTNNDMKIEQKFTGGEKRFDKFVDHISTQIEMFASAMEGNITKVNKCIDNGADVKARNNLGETCLHFAAKSDNVELFKFFLRRNVRMVGDHRGVTPLQVAIAAGSCKVSRFIIEEFNVNVSDKIDNFGTTLLHLAAENGRENVANMLIKDADVNALREMDGTPLHTAVVFGFKQVVRILLKNGCRVDDRSATNATPLQLAVLYGHEDIVRYLVEENNADLHADTLGSFTSLEIAIRKGWETIAIYLLNKIGALENATGNKLIYAAASLGFHCVATSLLDKGAKVTLDALEAAVTFGYKEVLIVLLNDTDIVYQHLLHYAASHGQKDIISYLIMKQYDVNFKYQFSTPLHYATDYGSVDIVCELLNAKAEINCVDEFKNTPLHLAAREGNADIVDVLLQHNANVHALNINSKTPLILAVTRGNFEIVMKLLGHGAELGVVDKNGQTPLHIAAAQGHVKIIDELLKKNADVNAMDVNRFSPLMRAAISGHNDAVNLLLKYGANVNYTVKYGMSSLYFAALAGHSDVAKTLLKYKAHDLVCQCFCLDGVVVSGKKDMLITLIKNGLNVDACGEDRLTPLHSAVLIGDVEMVSTLLDLGADVNFNDSEDWSPLHVAANFGFEKIVDILLNRGALVNEIDLDGATPLHLASGLEFNNTNIENHLTDDSVDFKNQLFEKIGILDNQYDEHLREILQFYKEVAINASNEDENCAALFDDASNEDETIKSWVKENMTKIFPCSKWKPPEQRVVFNNSTEVVKKLINHGAKVNAVDQYKLTPLHYATCNGLCDIGQILINKGVNVNAKDEDMMSALHMAVANNHADMVYMLLNNSADVNVVNSALDTPLHLALQCRFNDVGQILLNFGADINAKNSAGRSPFELAQGSEHSQYNGSVDSGL